MFKKWPSSVALLAAAFAAMGTIFFVVGAHVFYRNWQFSGDVVRVTGIVTGQYITVSHSRGGEVRTYHLDYRFDASDGSTRFCNEIVTLATYLRLRESGPVPIKYLPHIPNISRVDFPAEDRNHQVAAWIFMLAGGVFGGLGWFVFIGLERMIFYRRWLRRRGVHCVGKVEEIKCDTSVIVGKRNPSYLMYSYTDSTGRMHQAGSQDMSGGQETLWKEGDPIDVYYDPRDFSKSTAVLNR